jgi:hypothetical protein
MYVSGFEEAKQQARANADHFQCTYYVIMDTSGNYRVERDKTDESHTLFVAQPVKRA